MFVSALACSLTQGVPLSNPVSPYGICAHLTRSESLPRLLDGNVAAMKMLGVGYVRCDFDPYSIPVRSGVRDYSKYDAILDRLDRENVRMLPILRGYDQEGRGDKTSDLVVYSNYVTEVVGHFGNRMPVWEVFNEANLNAFFSGADPVRYAAVLKTAYGAIKAVNPALKVAFTGTAGVPVGWIRQAFAAGATNCFDIMNVHPYAHPRRPEEILAQHIKDVKTVLADFGCADKPIWFTEIGWPTHVQQIPHSHILTAGLKLARPEQRCWRILVAAKETNASRVSHDLEDRLLDVLPAGSDVRAFSQPDTVCELTTNHWDAVFYPLDETFPSDTVVAVNDFIRRGGVFIDLGGLPCYYGFRDDVGLAGDRDGAAISRFPFDYRAWWHSDAAAEVPRDPVATFATETGLTAGVKQEPTGFPVKHFVTTRRDAGPCEFFPLVAGVSSNGQELVSAAVIRYQGDCTGAAVLSTIPPSRGVMGTNDERNQAAYTARALGISFAENIEAYFAYCLRAVEVDPCYSEHHFGILHADFQPKPAYAAYMTFIRERPEGSKQQAGSWHDGNVYCPRWLRPDGSAGGMIWTKGTPEQRVLSFAQGKPAFCNMFGLRVVPRCVGDNDYLVSVSGDPIYFQGAQLKKVRQRR